MEISTLDRLLKANDANALRQAFIREHNSRFDPIDFMNYDPATHRIVRDRLYRPDKLYYREIPNEYDTQGKPVKELKFTPVTRTSLAFQQEIVDTTVSFSVGGPITQKATPTNNLEASLYDSVKGLWASTKMKFKVKDIARKLYSETECAVIMYTQKDDDNEVEVKLRIVSPSSGDVLYPIYNGLGDMIAFGFEYITSDFKFHFDVYTKDYFWYYVDNNGLRLSRSPLLNIYGKIPVAYFNQVESEWKKVQSLIERIELTISNLCDTNDYNGSPILFGSGKIDGFSDKGETGKLVTGEDGAKLEYLTWDKAPESIKLEIEILKEQIYNKTRTVDLSPSAIKGMGTAPSGVAFDRMLISPHMKAQDKQDGSLGEGLQRIINLFKAVIVEVLQPKLKPAKKLNIENEFSLFRIDGLEDKITTMALALPGKQLVSLKTAVTYIGATNDVDAEVEAIKEEDTEDAIFNNPTPVA